MMKAFKVIGMALLAIFVSLNFVACSSDDDDASLADTTWKVVSVSSSDWEDFKVGNTVTLKNDGNIVFAPTNDWNYAKWSLSDNVLTFTVGEESKPDDKLVGNITFNGNKATWTCHWEDAEDNKTDKNDTTKDQVTISFEKQ